ncbi:MAG: YHS domain-containing protein [Gammaproteobacteria bacterium]|nr:YHS domain-containing protein [Gammaproteobacteria bacterium]
MDPDILKNVGWLLLWGGLFLVMMRYGCGAHVTGGHGRHAGHGGHGGGEPAAGGKVRDPVCGMEVDPHTAVSTLHQDRTFYFCSTTCRDRFAQAPDQYTGAPMPGGHHHD